MPNQLGKIAVGLRLESGARLKGLGGEALHGLFLRLLNNHSPELASKMHIATDQRPFSLIPPLKDFEFRHGYAVFSPGSTLNFGIAFLSRELLEASISAFISILGDGQRLNLLRKPAILQNVDLCIGLFSSFPEIFSEASVSSTATLEFVTPTAFKKNEMQIVFPHPELVFSSLLKRWNAFSELKIAEEHTIRFASIKVSSYQLCTELLHFSSYKMVGFKGRVEYELPDDAPDDFLRDVNALADFASYSGVGVKTSMGMGQVRRIN
jgi:CRISPR-associated endoribonuclease Cas6